MGLTRRFADDSPMTSDNLSPIDLAKEEDFTLGGVSIHPSRREIVAPSQSVSLEPRVMQVLVALAQAGGETVGRDTLIYRCWGGVVVGEDAIQRCIGRLRKVSEAVGGFRIETLSRIGYRLLVDDAPNRTSASAIVKPARLLAVLPFDNLSEDSGLAYVADGVADEILQAIARRSTIKAIGRTSSFQFRGGDKVVAQISEALGATHVLDGSVRKAGPRVRIAAHLMDLADQSMIWSDRFDGAMEDLFALQEEVARATVAALNGAFIRAPTQVPRAPRTHDLLLRLGAWTGPVEADDVTARTEIMAELESVAGQDAEIWGRISAAHAAIRWLTPKEEEPLVRERAQRAAERALSLDPTNGAAHKALYLVEPPIGRFLEQERRLIAARDSAPEDGELNWSLYAHFLSVGRLGDSFAEAESAYRVDPLRPANLMAYANALFTSGRDAQALALMRHGLDRWPRDPIVFAISVWTAASAGEFAFVDQVMAKAPMQHLSRDAQGLVARAHFAIEALRFPSSDELSRAMTLLREEIVAGPPRLSLIGLCAMLGADLELLYDLVERANFEPWKRPEATLPPLDGLPHLFLRVNARLRQSPRFVELCGRLGLIDYWRETGVWPDCVPETAGTYDFMVLAQSFLG
jgi:TolB-like protein